MNSTIVSSSSSENNYEFRALSDVQKQALAILPIPSALLSIFGSTIIIVMLLKVRTTKSWIPYQRLLLAMSVCDIISSLTLAAGSFLYPRETSDKVWVIGNDASCSVIGFLNQVSYSGILYNGMLSFYFLFTARFGMKNGQIQKRIEPAMHIFSIGFPFVTAFVGLFMGVYHEPELGIGCWVNRWPDLCGEGPDGTGEECQSPLIAWIFGAWIALGVLATLIVNNVVIWVFVHKRTTTRGQGARISRVPSTTVEEKGDDTSDSHSHQSEDEESKTTAAGRNSQMGLVSRASSFRTLNSARVSGSASVSTAAQREFQATQNKRLRLVGSQAFLFVGCYFVSNIWTYILRLYEAQATDYVEEKELPYRYYALLVLQAALLPLQGLFNMIVFIRPKYLRLRSDFPSESKWSITHRVIFGEAAKANGIGSAERVTGKQLVEVKPPKNKGVSSLTLNSEVPQPSAVPPTQATKTETSPDDAADNDDSSGISKPGMSKDLSAILELSERTATERTRTSSERNMVQQIMEQAAHNRQQHETHSGPPRSRHPTESASGDSSLIMQTGWSSSLGSLSSSMQTRTSLPDGTIPFIPGQMPSGSSSDGHIMHTGWSTCSESTGASKRISKQEKQSSESLSIFAHTGWSDDSIPQEQVRQRVSMNIEAKRKQLLDMQYNDDDESDTSVDLEGADKPESVLTLNDPEDNTVTVPPIAPKMGTSTQAPPSEANSSGRDSFFMSTGWSNDNLPLVSDSPEVKSSKHTAAAQNIEDDPDSDLSLLGMKTGWSSDEIPVISPRTSPNVMIRKSMDLGDLQNTVMSTAKKSSSSFQIASSTSLSLHATIEEEESSMEASDEEPPPKPISSASSSTRQNSATMIMMDGSLRRTSLE